MNHLLGKISILKWKCDYIAAFGKPPSVAETFGKAYLGIDPLTPPSCPTEESSEPLSQNSKLLAKHQVSVSLLISCNVGVMNSNFIFSISITLKYNLGINRACLFVDPHIHLLSIKF